MAESTMRSGALVPDRMILRLILNELKTRGWLFPPAGQTITMASMSASYTGGSDNDLFVEQPSLAELEILLFDDHEV